MTVEWSCSSCCYCCCRRHCCCNHCSWFPISPPCLTTPIMCCLDICILFYFISWNIFFCPIQVHHHLMTKYMPEQLPSNHDDMLVRAQIAALDRKSNAGRQHATTATGSQHYESQYSRYKGDCTAKKILEEKTFPQPGTFQCSDKLFIYCLYSLYSEVHYQTIIHFPESPG